MTETVAAVNKARALEFYIVWPFYFVQGQRILPPLYEYKDLVMIARIRRWVDGWIMRTQRRKSMENKSLFQIDILGQKPSSADPAEV